MPYAISRDYTNVKSIYHINIVLKSWFPGTKKPGEPGLLPILLGMEMVMSKFKNDMPRPI